MLLSALMEVVSLGAVMPFIGALTMPEKVFNYPMVASMARTLGIATADQLVLPLTLAFAIAALTAGAVRLLFLWVNLRVTNATGAELAIEGYRRTLYQPYRVHVSRNSSVVIADIEKIGVIKALLQSVLAIISSVVLIVSIMLALLAINAEVAILAAAAFGISYWVIDRLSCWRLRHNSRCIAREAPRVIKALQEGLGGIRDILLDGTQAVYCKLYGESQTPKIRAEGNNQFLSSSPRHIMEALGMILIAGLAYHLSLQEGGVGSAIPVLGALALGAQRLLPAIQQLYSAWAGIVGYFAVLVDAINLLDQPLPVEVSQSEPDPEPLKFRHTICFDKVFFRYSDDAPWILDAFDLTISKGAHVGFVGSTGSGKSTTLDLLMGLLEPTRGQILVDNRPVRGAHRRAWQKAIAHVPQSIYLADTTLAENIAFGVPREFIDMDRVRQAARQAQIAEFIESRPDRYQEFVGERGVRLSGGQRQRIGIARALYKQAAVLVFDEATSALDNATEQVVVADIEKINRDITVLMIAHRLTTVRRCDVIIELEHGHVVGQGPYEQLLETSSSFRSMAQVGKMESP